jgi:hypothetical protein
MDCWKCSHVLALIGRRVCWKTRWQCDSKDLIAKNGINGDHSETKLLQTWQKYRGGDFVKKINLEEHMQKMDSDGSHEVFKQYAERLNKTNTELLTNIKARLPELEALLESSSSMWRHEDPVYRFYHTSFKVYNLQDITREIVDILFSLAPEGTTINDYFQEILAEGMSGKKFELNHNQEWTKQTRPFVEAYFHAQFFLEMAVKYGRKFDSAPEGLPSGWATLLYLYNIRF